MVFNSYFRSMGFVIFNDSFIRGSQITKIIQLDMDIRSSPTTTNVGALFFSKNMETLTFLSLQKKYFNEN